MDHSISIPKKVAIIGAGIAGISAAWRLNTLNKDFKITIFEKSTTLGGRVATRRKEGFYWDNGANYFSCDDEELEKMVLQKFSKGQIVEIPKPIWTFNKANELKEGDPNHNKKKKYSLNTGIKQLVKNVWSEVKNVDLIYEKRLLKLIQQQNSSQWSLISTENEDLGVYDYVLLTAPSPQTADILEQSEFLDKHKNDGSFLLNTFKDNKYKAIIAVTFAFKKNLNKEWFALLNSDREHNISWLSVDSDKKGHAPDGVTTIVVQMAESWSVKNYEASNDDISKEVFKELKTLLPDDKLDEILLWDDIKKWKLALPSQAIDPKILGVGAQHNLHFAGDFLVGRGRVLGAMDMGLKAGDRIIESIKKDNVATASL